MHQLTLDRVNFDSRLGNRTKLWSMSGICTRQGIEAYHSRNFLNVVFFNRQIVPITRRRDIPALIVSLMFYTQAGKDVLNVAVRRLDTEH